jgi:hypothetical protein
MAHTLGFATGGYLAGRLREPAADGTMGETAFRDATEGLVVWALGVVAIAAIAGVLGVFAVGTASRVATQAATQSAPAGASAAAMDYYVDLLFRPRAVTAAGGQPNTASEATTVGLRRPPRRRLLLKCVPK